MKTLLCWLLISSSAFGPSMTHASSVVTSDIEVDNMVAFIQLYGYVRYFYPKDVMNEAEWDLFASQNITSVKNASDAIELARQLSDLFLPYAPDLYIHPTDSRKEISNLKSDLKGIKTATFRMHIPLDNKDGKFSSGQLIDVHVRDGSLPKMVDLPKVNLSTTNIVDSKVPIPLHHLYNVNLANGVSAKIPLVLFNAEDKPNSLSAQGEIRQPEEPVSSYAQRLGTLTVLWNVFQHFFPYWEEVDINWIDALRDAIVEVEESDDPQDFLYILQRLTAQLEDGHTLTGQIDKVFLGNNTVPFSLDVIEGKLVVTTLYSEDNTSEVGDVITEVEGEPALMALSNVERRVGGTGQFRTFLGIQRLISSTDKLPIKLTTGANLDNAEEIVVPRSVFKSNHLREPRPPVVARLADKIMYVDLTRVSEGQFWSTMWHLRNASGIVFDMRGYPNDFALKLLRHLTDAPLSSPPFLLPVITLPDHKDVTYIDISSIWVKPQRPRLTDNIVFLINGNNAVSYAESILGIVEGYSIGERVGSNTAGANGDVIQADLPGGFWTTWSGLRVTKFDDSPLFKVGVNPTIFVERTLEGVSQNRDELLERGFDVVSGRANATMEVKEVWAPGLRSVSLMIAGLISVLFAVIIVRSR